MKILMIGGPKFLGRHITTAAIAAGHRITHFNRGNYPAGDLPDVEVIRGDRYRDLDKLAGRKWDAVIDNCGYLPQGVKASAEALKHSVDRYVFISSISAYADFSTINFDETAPPAALSEEQQARVADIDISGEITAFKLKDLYGALKAGCEQAIENIIPGRTIIVRPGLIVGPYDVTDRFTYWVMRVARGGDILAPGSPDRFVQLIDARDLAEWTIKLIENNETGTYNATGNPLELTMGNMLTRMKEVSKSDALFNWAGEEFLTPENIKPWSEMPLYMPESDAGSHGFLTANIDRALEKGLEFRPLKETIEDTFNWRKQTPDDPLKAGITAEREIELLKKLKSSEFKL